MKKQLKLCALPLAAAMLLSGCGGGDAGEQVGFLTITNASVTELNGSYGDGSATVTDVSKIAATGSDPEVCNFKFDNAGQLGGSGVAAGDVRYQPNTDVLYRLNLTVRGRAYSTANGDGDDTDIHHSNDNIELDRKKLTATDGSGDTLRVTALLPMHGGRPTGC
ncbi:hypothetical protein AAFF27_16640 [Xylophilus sp. GW821-FHT01B05]